MPIVIGAITTGVIMVTKNLIKNRMEAKEFEPFCGTRPVFIGKRRDTWNDCVKNLPDVIPVTVPTPPTGQPPTGNNGNPPSDTQTVILPTDRKKLTTNQKLLIGGGIAVGLFLLYKLKQRN
jgi:hypothetical protein